MTALAPSLDEIERMARAAWAEVPGALRSLAGDLVFRVQDFADEEVLAELGLEDPFELSGLYVGVELAQRSILDNVTEPAMVFLFRRPILDEWIERGDVELGDLVSHVLVHEIGHHFGFSDADMDALLDEAD